MKKLPRVLPKQSSPGRPPLPSTDSHPDDLAVDRFATFMKAKLAAKRSEGFGGWEDCPPSYLSRLLREHVDKGDPIDVANFAIMLQQRGERIDPTPDSSLSGIEAVVMAADNAIVSAVFMEYRKGEAVGDRLLDHEEVRSRVAKAIRATLSATVTEGE